MKLVYVDIEELFTYFKKFQRAKKIEENIFSEKFSRKKVEQLKMMIKWLSDLIHERLENLDDFIQRFADILRTAFKIDDCISLLKEKYLPLNSKTLQWALQKVDIPVDTQTARSLIKYMRTLKIVEFRPLPVIIRGKQDEILEYIIRKGRTRYINIISKFGESLEYILELYSEGKINIIGIEELGIKREDIVNVRSLDVSKLNLESKFIRIVRDSEGNMFPVIVVPKNTVIEINMEGVGDRGKDRS